MRELDGGNAGGQFLRSALSLAAVTGQAVRIENVRGSRSTPGLRPQHVAVMELLTRICDADSSGVEEGAEAVTFDPDAPSPGAYEIPIGTAGSVYLLFDAVLPLATVLAGPIRVTAHGGTDVKWAPTSAHYRRVKLPTLRRHGLAVTADLETPGFYPTGGGTAHLRLWPSSLEPIRLIDPGPVQHVRITSMASTELGDANVAARQARAAADEIPAKQAIDERTVTYVEAPSPGSAVCVSVDTETSTAGFDALGERGTPAESVGATAGEAAREFLDGPAGVDRHLADQLLLYVALGGGRVRIPAVTEHVRTSLNLLEAMGRPLELDRSGPAPVVSRT